MWSRYHTVTCLAFAKVCQIWRKTLSRWVGVWYLNSFLILPEVPAVRADAYRCYGNATDYLKLWQQKGGGFVRVADVFDLRFSSVGLCVSVDNNFELTLELTYCLNSN